MDHTRVKYRKPEICHGECWSHIWLTGGVDFNNPVNIVWNIFRLHIWGVHSTVSENLKIVKRALNFAASGLPSDNKDKLLLLPGWLLKILQSCQHCLHHDTISQKWLSHDSSKLISRPFRNNYVWDVLRLWPQVSVARQSTFACNRIVWMYKSVSGYPGTYPSTPSESECSPAHTGAHCLNI